ncbi:MAG: alpha/beta hydrolase [Burkholderiaceae bacterium]
MNVLDARQQLQAGPHRVMADPQTGRPLLLLLRMAGRDAGLWDAAWPLLSTRFRVAQFDLPMPQAHELEAPRDAFFALAQTVGEVADALGHDRYSVLGWQGGTHVALHCAVQQATRVALCMLVGPFFKPRDPRRVDGGLAFLQALFERGDANLYATYWFFAGLSPHFLEHRFDDVAAWITRRVAGDKFLSRDAESAMRWMRSLRANWLSDAEYRSVAAPVLVLAPALDGWHAGPTVAMAGDLQARLPDAELDVLDGLGHLALLEDPARTLQALGAFCARHDARL